MVTQRIARPMSGQRLAGRHRPVDWRDQRAVALVAEDRAPSPRLDDPVVTSLTHFYRRRRDCRSVHDRDRLARAMSHVFSAVRLHKGAPALTRTVVEALVLADQPRELIAACAGMTEEAMEFFEKAFFDVRDRLADYPFIIESVVRLQEASADSEAFASAMVKLLSYYTGPGSINLLIIPRGDQLTSIREVASKLVRRSRILLHMDSNRSESSEEARRKQEMLRAIEAIEEYSGEYGDESIPRTEEQLVEARSQVLDDLLRERMRGGKPMNREGRDVQ